MPEHMPEVDAGGYYLLALRVPGEALDAASEALRQAGASGVEVVDGDHLAPPADLGPAEVEVRAYFPAAVPPGQAREAAERFMLRAREVLPGLPWGAGPAGVRLEALRLEDWTESWRSHFHPVRLGRFFIHPSWVQPEPSAPFPILIDPGLAFGTGLHATTRLCVLELDELLSRRAIASVLDLGCGTGVLALGAARAGVPRVVAVDNDPEACRVTRENLVLNGLAGRIEVVLGEAREVAGRFQVVLANILSGVLVAQAAEIAARLEPGGALLLSGLLVGERDEVRRAYQAVGCRARGERVDGEWALLRLEPEDG